MMVTSSPYRPSYGANDWTSRLPPGSPSTDQGMVATPYADPGYGMPNPYIGNLNQSPGVAVGGYLPVSDNTMLQPGVAASAPQNRLAPWSNFGADETPSESDYWLQQARRLAANPNDYGKPEPLPGITSGAPRYGQDTSQLHWQRPPTWTQQLGNTRPADYNVDPGMLANPQTFKVWRGGRVSVAPSAAPTSQTMPWRAPPTEQTD